MTTPPQPVVLLPEELSFGNNYGDDQTSTIRIVNDTDKIIAWRVRADLPDMYRFDSEGFIDPGQNKDLAVVLKKGFVGDRGQLPKHRLTFLSLQVSEEEKRKSITEIYATGQKPAKRNAAVNLHPPAGAPWPW